MRLSKYTKDTLGSYVARNIFLGVLQAGPIPEHVAFIMDGNRRYSRTNGVPVAKGHYKGSQVTANVSLIQIPAYFHHHS
jgi:ditrans,polycis-polyprenyl diphosphate synthase